MNGIGPTIYGRPGDGDVYKRTMYFAVLWLPVAPIAQYRVSRDRNGDLFHEEHRPEDEDWLYPVRVWFSVALAPALIVSGNMSLALFTLAGPFLPLYWRWMRSRKPKD
jgi:hypothetical protein